MSTLLTGGSGRLGSELLKHLKNSVAPSSKELDITNPDLVRKFFKKRKINTVIHCAAMTNVNECESDPDKALRTNIFGTMNLYNICREHGAKLVYISTDHIFDGKRGNYKEEDVPNPGGVYAMTKYLAEKITLLEPKNLVIRTSFLKGFEMPRAFVDKYFSGDTVDIIAKDIILAVKSDLRGTWNIGRDKVAIYEIARKIKPDVGRIRLKENPVTKSGLPYLKDVSLDVSRWKEFKRKAGKSRK